MRRTGAGLSGGQFKNRTRRQSHATGRLVRYGFFLFIIFFLLLVNFRFKYHTSDATVNRRGREMTKGCGDLRRTLTEPSIVLDSDRLDKNRTFYGGKVRGATHDGSETAI